MWEILYIIGQIELICLNVLFLALTVGIAITMWIVDLLGPENGISSFVVVLGVILAIIAEGFWIWFLIWLACETKASTPVMIVLALAFAPIFLILVIISLFTGSSGAFHISGMFNPDK